MAPWIQDLHYPILNIPVTIDKLSFILPSSPVSAATKCTTLYLSNLDDMVSLRFSAPTIYFYKLDDITSSSIIEILKYSLSQLLVLYYPFSGRIRETSNGKLEVYFGENQGVLFVEAHSEMEFSELGDLYAPNPSWTPLIYRYPDENNYKAMDLPLMIVQVTLFRKGGFSLGLRLSHCICDGIGAMQYIEAWATTARLGSKFICPQPCWDREILRPRELPKITCPHVEFLRLDEGSSITASMRQGKLIQKCYRVSYEFQARIKALAQPKYKNEEPVSGFASMAAHLWKSWVRALEVTPIDYPLRLTFSVNIRPKISKMQSGYYGNALCVACTVITVKELIENDLSVTANLIAIAKNRVTDEHVKSTIDYLEIERPTRMELAGKLSITQWTRFPLYDSADFRWGRPVYAGPIDLSPTPQLCMFLPDGEADPVVRSMILCICLPESAISGFNKYFFEIDR